MPTPAQLPLDADGFVGRAHELKRLDAILDVASGHPAVVTISAAGGAGKTALAVHWGHRVAARFPDGQLYIDLKGYAQEPPVRPVEALAGFLCALGVPVERIPLDVDRAAALYRSMLAGRRMLLILDNARGAEQIRPLLPGWSGCAVVVTSRARLTGPAARDGSHRLLLDGLTPDEAGILLTRILGEQRMAAEPDAAAALVRFCGCLPLALRIAAAHLTDRPNRTIAAHVGALAEGGLAALCVDGDPQATLRVVFDQSYATLDPAAQRLFRLLGRVPGPDVTPDAVAALAAVTAAEAGQLLERLAAAHVLVEQAPGRYAFHDLIRSYAAELAGAELAAGEVAATTALGRLFDWYLRIADAAADLIYPQINRLPGADGPPARVFPDGATALAWLTSERPNLLGVVRHCARCGPHPVAWRLADCLRGYIWQSRQLVDWLDVARAALDAATQDGSLEGQAAMWLALGNASHCLDDYRQAVQQYATASALAERAGWLAGSPSTRAGCDRQPSTTPTRWCCTGPTARAPARPRR